MSGSVGTEREFKFDVGADFDPPDLRPLVGRTVRLPEIHHLTEYLDTADHRLWDRGITLRYRSAAPAGGAEGDAGGEPVAAAVGGAGDGPDGGSGRWTLKLPVDAGATTAGPTGMSERSELTWDGTRDEVPAAARRIVAGVVRRAPLVGIARLEAVRRRLLLQAPDGDEPWGEVDDDLVSITAGPNAGQRFRQIEIELTGDADPPAGHVDAVVDLMRRAGAAPGGGSKLGMALGLTEPAPPARAAGKPGSRSRRRAPMSAVVSGILAADLDVVLDCDVRLRRAAEEGGQPEVELIHRARVGFRRLRAHLRTLDPVLDPVWSRHVRNDLKTVGRALGRVRDADVLLARLAAHQDPEDRDGLEELLHLVSADRALAAGELVPLMAGSGYLDLISRLASASVAPPMYSATVDAPARQAAGPSMHSLVARRWRRTTAAVAALGPEPSAQELHRVRIRAKRLRYAAEAAQPYIGRDGRRVARRAKSLQKVLGQVHDSTTAISWLRQLASHPSITPTAAFVAGRIAGQAEAAAGSLGRNWRVSAARLGAKRLRSGFG